MAKVDWIFCDEIDAIMDDIPDHLWMLKTPSDEKEQPQTDLNFELLSSW